MVAVEIQTILDEDPAQKFEILGSNGRVLPKLVKVMPVVKPIAAKQPKAAKPPNTVPSVAVAAQPTPFNISSDSASSEEECSEERRRELMASKANASLLAAWNFPGKRQADKAKESAAAAPTKTSKRLAKESVRSKPQVQEVCQGDEYCACTKCL